MSPKDTLKDGLEDFHLTRVRSSYEDKPDEALPPWLRSWLVVAAVWLQVIVVVFIVVGVSHVKTPVIYWVDKMTDLFTESR